MLAMRLLAPVLLLLGACAAQPDAVPFTPEDTLPVQPTPSAPSSAAATGGAHAAPGGAVYDASQEAADNYRAWLDYELDSEADRQRDFDRDAYPDGVMVCAQFALRAEPSETEARLKTKGWSGTGAAAVVKAALEALCAQFNTGYQTRFDRDVAAAGAVLGTVMTWPGGPPAFYELGYFMKSACGFLRATGSAAGLEAFLHSHRPGGANATGRAAAFVQRVPDDALLRRATNHVVLAGCAGDHRLLGYYWTNA